MFILSDIWKAHDSNTRQNNFIDETKIHDQSPWSKPTAIYLSKHPILIGNISSSVLTGNIKSLIYIGTILKAQGY